MEEVGFIFWGQFINQRLPTKNYLKPLSEIYKGGYNGFDYNV